MEISSEIRRRSSRKKQKRKLFVSIIDRPFDQWLRYRTVVITVFISSSPHLFLTVTLPNLEENPKERNCLTFFGYDESASCSLFNSMLNH